MIQEPRNNGWDPESNAQELDEGIFRREDLERATVGPHPGHVSASGVSAFSGYTPGGYATWNTATYATQQYEAGRRDYITTTFIEAPPYTLPNEYIYHGSSWKEALEASLFLIKYALAIVWRKYLHRPIGVRIRWEA